MLRPSMLMLKDDAQIQEGRGWALKVATAVAFRCGDLVSQEEMVSLADLGFIEACHRFDSQGRVLFTVYVAGWVRWLVECHIQRELEWTSCRWLALGGPALGGEIHAKAQRLQPEESWRPGPELAERSYRRAS